MVFNNDNFTNLIQFFKYIDPSHKYIRNYKYENLDELVKEIKSKKSWTVKSCNEYIDRLYEVKKKRYEEYVKKQISKEKVDAVDYWLQYIKHQLKSLTDFQSYILSIIATIFLPLSFITGFYGMNFISMSKKNGAFETKDAAHKIYGLSIIICLFVVYFFFGFLQIGV